VVCATHDAALVAHADEVLRLGAPEPEPMSDAALEPTPSA
jgi:hypothetical protein